MCPYLSLSIKYASNDNCLFCARGYLAFALIITHYATQVLRHLRPNSVSQVIYNICLRYITITVRTIFVLNVKHSQSKTLTLYIVSLFGIIYSIQQINLYVQNMLYAAITVIIIINMQIVVQTIVHSMQYSTPIGHFSRSFYVHPGLCFCLMTLLLLLSLALSVK